MGYSFSVNGYYTVKRESDYPWPCGPDPDRTIRLFSDDVLTKDPETGCYMKHTGLGCFGIVIPDSDVEFHQDTARLAIL